MKNEKEVKQKIKKIFYKVETKQCENCQKFISKSEFDAGEGACFRCWDNPKDLK